jgi:pimeloyl-ACP methyl ester carboxylesterase
MPSKTVVFVHGNFVTRACWDGWAARYRARGYACVQIAYPLRDKPVEELRRRHPDPEVGRLELRDVIDHHVQAIAALPEKPIIMGHSFGGLLTQLLLARGLPVAAVAIDSVPPPGEVTFKWSFIRSLWPVVNPLIPASRPYLMSWPHFRYTFANNMPEAEGRAAYDQLVVPESRTLGRGGLSSVAKIDFTRSHAPLLMIAGEQDNIMPASLNRSNFERYRKGNPSSVTEFREFPGRAHMILGQRGWEEVADYALEWAERVQGAGAAG